MTEILKIKIEACSREGMIRALEQIKEEVKNEEMQHSAGGIMNFAFPNKNSDFTWTIEEVER